MILGYLTNSHEISDKVLVLNHINNHDPIAHPVMTSKNDLDIARIEISKGWGGKSLRINN